MLFHVDMNYLAKQAKCDVEKSFTLRCLLTPLKYQVFDNLKENGAFAPLEQVLHIP